jgi:hypothetical protein
MIRNATLVSFSDLLTYATQKGFGWNEAHGILVPDEYAQLIPNHGVNEVTREEVVKEWVEGDCREIVWGYMSENGLTSMHVYYDK